MTVIEWGNFADGTINGELRDSSWNWFGPHVTLLKGQGPNGGNAVRLVGNDSMTFPNQGNLVRIHGIDIKPGTPSWFKNEYEVWRSLSARVPSGFTNTEKPTIDEIHGDNGTGPAPLNLAFVRKDVWYIYIRGSEATSATSGGFPFEQNLFGGHSAGTYDGTYYRHQYDWVGGNKPVIEDEWIHFRLGWFLSTDPSRGWFHGYARWGNMTEWREIVPKKTGIRTSYKDISGDGRPVYPMMSLYYNAGAGGENAVDFAAGAWSNSQSEVSTWQDNRLGFSGSVPPPPPPPLNDINLKFSRSGSVVNLQWDPQDCDGFRFYRNGKAVSSTFDGTRTTARMTANPGDDVDVFAIHLGRKGHVKV